MCETEINVMTFHAVQFITVIVAKTSSIKLDLVTATACNISRCAVECVFDAILYIPHNVPFSIPYSVCIRLKIGG